MSEGNMAGLNLDVEEEVKNLTNFDPLPEGEYPVVVTASELKDNKNGEGQHISVTMQVIEGDCEGRQLWGNFNIKNANPTAEKIGRAELASLCKAVRVANPKDTSDLHDIPFAVKVGMDKKDPSRNRIKAYIDTGATPAPAAPAKSEPKAAAPKPAAGGKKPWQR